MLRYRPSAALGRRHSDKDGYARIRPTGTGSTDRLLNSSLSHPQLCVAIASETRVRCFLYSIDSLTNPPWHKQQHLPSAAVIQDWAPLLVDQQQRDSMTQGMDAVLPPYVLFNDF